MIRSTSLVFYLSMLAFSPLAASGCEDSGYSNQDCGQAKCDDPGQGGAIGELMPRAPQVSGTINLRRADQTWQFEVVGSKGEVVLLSEAYVSKSAAINGALSSEENGVTPARYQVISAGSAFSFVLKAGNGEVLAEGQTFATESEAQSAAAAAQELMADIAQYRAATTEGAAFQLDHAGSSWKFELLSEEGEPLLKSQTYSRRGDAIGGIESVRKNGKDAARYVVQDSPARFIIKASNGQEIAESAANYPDLASAQAAAEETQQLLRSERVANPW